MNEKDIPRVAHDDLKNRIAVPETIVRGKEAVATALQESMESRQAERKLQASEASLRVIIAQMNAAQHIANIGSWVKRSDRDLPEWSDETFRIFGRSPEDGVPNYSEFRCLIHPDDWQIIDEAVQTALTTGQGYSVEFRIVRPGGEERIVYQQCDLFVERESQTQYLLGISQDITERKRAEQALRDSEENFRQIVERSSDVFYRQNAVTARFEYVSPKIFDLLGYSPAELIMMDLEKQAQQIHPDDLPHLVNFHLDVIEADGRGEKSIEREFRLKNKQGEYCWIHGNYSLIRDDDNNPQYIVGSLSNITQRKREEEEKNRLETQLQQVQKMESIGRLAGGVAHDFNNMLGVIIGHAELAMTKVSPSQVLYNHLEQIIKAAQHSADLTRQLLAFARRQTISPTVLNLNHTVTNMLTILKRLIGENIELDWLPAADLWPIKIDLTQVDQILANLCVNARDAITDVGKITIETENVTMDEPDYCNHVDCLQGDYIQLAVSDNGCGMDKSKKDHLFEPFFTTKGVGKGTGLGLATVYGIVKQNNGFIDVYSEVNRGTTFKIYLPRFVSKTAQMQKEKLLESVPRGQETILIVEDEPAILNIGMEMLTSFGYQVLTAGTPSEAIRLAEENAGEIDLLLTDVIMPEMNGRDLVKRLLPLHPNLKRLFTSGYTANVIAHHGVLDEGVHFIQKPFTINALAVKVREALDQK